MKNFILKGKSVNIPCCVLYCEGKCGADEPGRLLVGCNACLPWCWGFGWSIQIRSPDRGGRGLSWGCKNCSQPSSGDEPCETLSPVPHWTTRRSPPIFRPGVGHGLQGPELENRCICDAHCHLCVLDEFQFCAWIW